MTDSPRVVVRVSFASHRRLDAGLCQSLRSDRQVLHSSVAVMNQGVRTRPQACSSASRAMSIFKEADALHPTIPGEGVDDEGHVDAPSPGGHVSRADPRAEPTADSDGSLTFLCSRSEPAASGAGPFHAGLLASSWQSRTPHPRFNSKPGIALLVFGLKRRRGTERLDPIAGPILRMKSTILRSAVELRLCEKSRGLP